MMGKTTISGVMAMVLLALTAAGCQEEQRRDASLMQSQTLVDETAAVLADSMIARRDAGADLPEGYETDEFVESVLDAMLMQYPEAFTVTMPEERRLREGNLDDAMNAEVAGRLLEQAEANNVSLNTVTQYLAQQYEEGDISGVRLELLTRLLSAQIDAAMA